MAEVELVESATITKEPGSKGIYRIQLIEADVQGSTGFYPASVLERDGARAFPAGTHVFLDHPRESEEWERPERSVKDLAGVLLDAATYQDAKDGKGLFSRMQVFPDHKEFVEAKFPHMGMSIRALGIREYSSDTGLDTVTELVRGQSVDIVTRAGAGGRILEMTESARAAGKEAAPQVFELKETDKAGMQKLFEAVQALTTKVTQLEEKAATAEKKREEDATLSLGDIVNKLDASGLPGVSRKHLADTYTSGVDLDAAIKDEQARVQAIKDELGGPKGNDEGEDVNGPGQEQRESDRGVGRVQESNTGDAYSSASNIITGLFG